MAHLIQQACFLTAPKDIGTVVPCFTRALDLRGPVRSARLHISALGMYQAAIDGARVGEFVFAPGVTTEDAVMEIALEAGADDVIDDEDVWTLQTAMADFAAVRDALESAGVTMQSAELAMVPQNLVAVDAEAAQKVIRLMEALDDNDDVQNVYANADFPEDMDMD